VTVPISTWPKPSAAAAGQAWPFLSNPAARPTALGKLQAEGLHWAVVLGCQAMDALQPGAQRPHPAKQRERLDAEFVRAFRIEAKERGFDCVLVEPAHVSRTMPSGRQLTSPRRVRRGGRFWPCSFFCQTQSAAAFSGSVA
jgi:hypothetical protein